MHQPTVSGTAVWPLINDTLEACRTRAFPNKLCLRWKGRQPVEHVRTALSSSSCLGVHLAGQRPKIQIYDSYIIVLLLVGMPFVPSSFLLLVLWPGATSSDTLCY